MPQVSKLKTPKDVTEFEREQLRFFLARDDLAFVLAELNPSLAWLPILAELKLINTDTQLAMWLERNFSNPDTVRDVAANILFFRPDTADILEFRFNEQVSNLSPLLAKSWRLILRHIRNSKHGVLRDDWFDLAPRLKRGEHSAEVLEKLASVLKPIPVISKRFSWHDSDETESPQRPSDLMTINFEVEEDVSAEEVLSMWPENAPAQAEERLLRILTSALCSAAEDAIDAEVEWNKGFSATDSDVPSVATHHQNEYRKGFLPIVRVIAEIWTRLAKKDSQLALTFVPLWQANPLRIVRRLSLFAAADPIVSPNLIAPLLSTISLGELFLTNSSVEVYRLIDSRWHDLSLDQKQAVERHICKGPPPDWFKDDSNKERIIDRCRFDLLGHMKRNGLALSSPGEYLFQQIGDRYPEWELKPSEQAGFHIWNEGARCVVGDATKLENVPDDQLITEAKKSMDHADFGGGDAWRAICLANPLRAFRALEAQAATNEWHVGTWSTFFWAANKIQDPVIVSRIAEVLMNFPEENFETSDIAQAASWWLNENVEFLDDSLLWLLWDRIEKMTPREDEETTSDDTFIAAINAPSGRLAEIILKKMPGAKKEVEPDEAMRARLDRLIDAPSRFGTLARVRLAAEVSVLFDRFPKWTKERVVPLFDWSSPEASAVWSARQYSNYIGSPELFGLMKESFLVLFTRPNLPEDQIRTFSEWLVTVMLSNQSGEITYPISATEARSVLRAAGARSLPSIAHRLAIEMEGAKKEKKYPAGGISWVRSFVIFGR